MQWDAPGLGRWDAMIFSPASCLIFACLPRLYNSSQQLQACPPAPPSDTRPAPVNTTVEHCSANSCPEGFICVNDLCMLADKQCTTNSDCDAGRQCVNSQVGAAAPTLESRRCLHRYVRLAG